MHGSLLGSWAHWSRVRQQGWMSPLLWTRGILFLWDPWEHKRTSQNFCLKHVQQEVYPLAFPLDCGLLPGPLLGHILSSAGTTWVRRQKDTQLSWEVDTIKARGTMLAQNGPSMQLWLKSEVGKGGMVQGSKGIFYNSFYFTLNHKMNHTLLLMNYPQEAYVLCFKGIKVSYPTVIAPRWTLFQN